MKPLLIIISALDMATNTRVDVRVGSVPSPIYAGLGGYNWEGAVSRRPRFMQDLMSPDLDGKVQVARGDFALNLNNVQNVATPQALSWSGAPVTVYDASSFDYANMPVEFSGVVKDGSLDIWTRQLILNLQVEKSKMERPLLSLTFDGSGGLGGDANLRGTLKPAGFGFVQNSEPVWFDTTNNVGMLDGYGNLTSIQGFFEGGADRGASYGDYASYALLVAAPIPKGRWGTCLAQGLVRLGAPPAGRISCDATYRGAAGTGANLPGALIRRILEVHAGIATADLDTASFASLDTAVPRTVHYWTKDQRDCLDLVEAISASCNATTLILLNGKIAVTRAFGGTNIGTLNRTGTSSPAVTDWQTAGTEDPLWRLRARACRPGTVFSYEEILYEDDLIDRGAYSAAETYRQGHLVWMPDGSQWLYINATPGSGNSPAAVVSPATSNAYWQRTKAPTTAADLTYADGTVIETLKPAAPGATRNIIYPPSAVDPAGSNTIYNGDIWTDTSGTVPKIKTRTGGVWVISGNYVTQGTDINVANGATVNVITYSNTAPVTPGNGDIWVDTSATPNLVKVRVAGAWQTSSSLVTQGNDIGVANNAGTTLSLSIIGAAGTKNGPGNAASFTGTPSGSFDQGVVSDNAIKGGAYCEARFLTNFNSVFGFSTAKAAPWYNGGGWVLGGSNFAPFDESGTTYTAYQSVFSATAVLGFLYDGVFNYWFRDGTLVLQRAAATAGQQYVFNARFNATGASIDKIRFLTAADNAWSTTGGVGKPANNAGTTLNLYDPAGSAYTWNGNTVAKPSGAAAGWFGNVYSKEFQVGTAQISGLLDTIGSFFGLSDGREYAGATDYNYLDYAWHRSSDGNWYTLDSGNFTNLGSAGFSATTAFLVTYDGVNIKFWADAVLKKTVASAAGRTFYAGLSLNGAGAQVSQLQFGAYTVNDAGAIMYGTGSSVASKEPFEAAADKTQNQQVTIEYSTTSFTVNLDSGGGIVAGQLPLVLPRPTVMKGGTNVTGDNLTTYSISGASAALGTVTVDNTNGSSTKGQPTLANTPTAFTGAGSFFLNISYNGVALTPVQIKIVTKQAQAANSGGTGSTSGTISVGETVTSTTDVQIGNTTTVTVASGKSISVSFGDNYTVTGGVNKDGQLTVTAQYSVAGANSWSAIGSSVTGSQATNDADGNKSPGAVNFSPARSVTPAANTYDVRLVGRKSGTGTGIALDVATANVNVV